MSMILGQIQLADSGKTNRISGGIIIIFLFICLLWPFFVYGLHSSCLIDKHIVLLLNSGLTDCDSAKIKIILWTEKEKENQRICKELSQPEYSHLEWKSQKLFNYYGKTAYKYSAELEVNQKQETGIITIANSLAKDFSTLDVKLYLQETINKMIEPKELFALNNGEIKDHSFEGNVCSYSGTVSSYHDKIRVGANYVNFQVLTTKNKRSERTSIAFPMILEEF